MKRLVIALCTVLALGYGYVSAAGRGPGHQPPHHHGYNPPPHHPPHHHYHNYYRPPQPPRPVYMPYAQPPCPVAPVYVSSLPSVGFSIDFGGLNFWFSGGQYYRNVGPCSYQVVTPPIGMMVPQLYNPWTYWLNNILYYVSGDVVYTAVNTPRGVMYQVAGYR